LHSIALNFKLQQEGLLHMWHRLDFQARLIETDLGHFSVPAMDHWNTSNWHLTP
jgi:hypothetical protein